jgi:hypothetical protein
VEPDDESPRMNPDVYPIQDPAAARELRAAVFRFFPVPENDTFV